MGRNLAITAAESKVMHILWQSSPMATEDIVVAVGDSERWHISTVKTLLSRLLNKGAIRAQKDGRRYLYSPVMQREEWLADESTSVLDRLFGGRVAPLVAHFSQRRKLSRKDLADLRKLIDELDDDR